MKKWQAGIFLTAIVGVFAGSAAAFVEASDFKEIFRDKTPKYVSVDCYTSDSQAGTATLTQGGQDISGQSVQEGVRVTLTAVEAPGYVFVGWYRVDNGQPLLDNDNKPVTAKTYTFNAFSTKLEARFRPVNAVVDMKTVEIRSQQLENGAIAGKVQGGGQYVLGGSATIVATPFYGFDFLGWYDGDDLVSNAATYTFAVEGDISLAAKWAVKKYSFTIAHEIDGVASEAGVAGTIEDAPTDPVVHGGEVILLAKEKSGYVFDGWYEGAICKTKEAQYRFTADRDRNLTAKWKEIKYNISVTKNFEEAGEVTGAGTYKEGASVTLTATENKGYKFLGWYEGDKAVPLSEELTYTFNAEANLSLTARWEVSISEYVVNVLKNIENAGTATGGGLKVEGTSVTLEATCEEGYRFVGWFVGGVNVCETQSYTFDVTQEVTVTATWEIIEYTINLTVDPADPVVGTVTGAGTYEYGEEVTLEATTTSEGYTFLGWFVGGESISSEATFTFVPDGDKDITAKWKINTYALIVNKNIGTAGDIEGAGEYAYGASVTLIATENPGYAFLGWYADGSDTPITTDKTYTFTLNAATTLMAKWEVTAYNINVENSNESAGTVTDGGLVNIGESITLTAVENEGYEFVGWFDGALSLSADKTYTFTPEGNMTITAQWKLSESATFDPNLITEITGHVATISNVELGTRQSIPIVYVTYGGQKLRAFPYVTCDGVKVDVGSRGTKFLVETPNTHIIQYYIDVGGKACAVEGALTTVYVVDTSGPTFNLPASADGMLVYKNQVVTLPDWTAVDPSGVDGDVEVSITYGGSAISFDRATRTFTPTQIGKYVVTYKAKDTKGNETIEEFTIECKLMVELCNFDSLDVAAAYAYTTKNQTRGELSETYRYGNSGSSLKFTGVGTGADGIIKAYAIPMYYDLSGFDEIALYVWSDQALTGVSAGIYLLNNEGYSEVPINLAAGENIVKFDKTGFQASYPGGTLPNNDLRVEYRTEDYVWFQFRAPEGCNLYIDNLVGIFNDYSGADNVKPIVDLGAGYMIAQTMANNTLYAGEYGNITCWTGESLKTAIDRSVRGYDNSAEAVTVDYTVKNASNVDVTAQVKSGALVGSTAGEKFTITAWVTDKAGNVSTSKTGEIRVRNKPIEHTMEGHETRRLNVFNSSDLLVGDNNLDVSIDSKVNKDGRIKIKTKDLWEEFTIELKLKGEILTPEMINTMKYINLNIFSYNAASEFYVNNTLITRVKGGWNDIAFDANMLLESGAYDTTTGMLKLKVYSPLDNTMELVFQEAVAVYDAGTAPGGADLNVLKTPVVTIDGTTGVASWEAIPNASAYIYTINNGSEIEIPATQLSVQLSDGDEFRVRAKGDGVTYEDSAMSSNQLYLDGADLLNNCEQEGYGVFEVNTGVSTMTTSTEHVKEGSKSVKVVFSQDSYFVVFLKKGSNPVSLEDLAKYEYIEFNVYSDTAGVQLLFGGGGVATWFDPGIVVGDNVIRLTREYLLEQIDTYGTLVYNPEMGSLTMNTNMGCTLYFDKFVGKIDPTANLTKLTTPSVSVDATSGLATWAEVSNASGYKYKINGGAEQSTDQTSVQLNVGDTIQVKAVGDGETYADSSYSATATYYDPDAGEVMLNNCEVVNGWVQSAVTPTLSTSNVFEGANSVEVTVGEGAYINVRLADASPDLATLKATYETIKLNVYSSYAGTNSNTLWLGDAADVADWQARTVAKLSQGDNVVEIPTSMLDSTMYIQDAYGGGFLSFRVGGACTIRIDNVLGVRGDGSGSGSGSGDSGTTTPDTPENTETLLNSCDSADGFWCAAGTSVNTDSAYVEQGTGSVCVSTTGWAPINVNWGTASITDYSSVKMTIWADQYVRLLAGDIDFNDDPDCVLAELQAGKNEVTIPVSKLVEYGLTAQICAPYLSGAATLYIDNIIGVPYTETLLNSCDAIEGFACIAGATLNTDVAYVNEGSASVKMDFTGWSWTNMNLGTSSITNYTYVKMMIYSTNTVKLLAGDLADTDDNNVLANLTGGQWNEVTIPVTKLVEHGLTAQIIAPWVNNATTIYIDNIVGLK